MTDKRTKINIRAIIKRKIKFFAKRALQKLPAGLQKEHYQDALITYDKRSGSYVDEYMRRHDEGGLVSLGTHYGEIKQVNYGESVDLHNKWLSELVASLLGKDPGSVLEAGAGECTTLLPVAEFINQEQNSYNGSDISWSRCKFARDFSAQKSIALDTLSAANILQLPYPDNSIDIVYSHYCLEELGGYELEAIQEMYRVARKYVFVIEASYELGSKGQRTKLYNRGWNLGIIPSVKKLGYKILKHELVPYCHDAYHHGALVLIEKNPTSVNSPKAPSHACPKCHSKLTKIEHGLKCEPCGLVYSNLQGIPVFLLNNAIVASHCTN
tara:strand:+ start:756 stop:1733 length:978 start_codon:yes stop_codon:yes gene_type:complete